MDFPDDISDVSSEISDIDAEIRQVEEYLEYLKDLQMHDTKKQKVDAGV